MGCYVWKNILVKVNSFKAFDTRTQTDPKRSDDSRVHRLTARDGAPALSEDQRVGLSLNFGPFGGRGKARHRFRLRSALVAGDAQRLRACPRNLRAPPFVSLLSCPPVPSLVLVARASSLPPPTLVGRRSQPQGYRSAFATSHALSLFLPPGADPGLWS